MKLFLQLIIVAILPFCFAVPAQNVAGSLLEAASLAKAYNIPRDLFVIVNTTKKFIITFEGELVSHTNVSIIEQHAGLVQLWPNRLELEPRLELLPIEVNVHGISPGHFELSALAQPENINVDELFVRVTVANSYHLTYVSVVIGWLYFIAWSASFYPQIYDNFKRKSVVGLNFDYLSFNIIGFVVYSSFNVGMVTIPDIYNEYMDRYPRGLIPVLFNDVLFSLHALFACFITAVQCIIYESGVQRISSLARSILLFFFGLIGIFAGLAINGNIHWLDFLYYCSFIKLSINFFKYIPQVLMNYKRKSTEGWSIGCIYLDIVGGIFSIFQMLINAHNYDDWASIIGDPTKFGLGMLSIFFDIVFIVQHHVLYRYTRSSPTRLKVNDSNLEKLLSA